MELGNALTEVATEYNSGWSEYNIQYNIFTKLLEQSNDVDINDCDCILFFEQGQIRYRKTFTVTVSGNMVYNRFGFKEYIDEVIPYNKDPEYFKQIIKKFVSELKMGNIQHNNNVDNIKIANQKTDNIKKGNKMKDVVNKMIEANKENAVSMAKLEMGKSANRLVLDKVKPKLPMYVQGYADSPLAELVIANIVSAMLIQFASKNKKAEVLANAMLEAGMQTAIESFDVPGLVKELLANVDLTGTEE